LGGAFCCRAALVLGILTQCRIAGAAGTAENAVANDSALQ